MPNESTDFTNKILFSTGKKKVVMFLPSPEFIVFLISRRSERAIAKMQILFDFSVLSVSYVFETFRCF